MTSPAGIFPALPKNTKWFNKAARSNRYRAALTAVLLSLSVMSVILSPTAQLERRVIASSVPSLETSSAVRPKLGLVSWLKELQPDHSLNDLNQSISFSAHPGIVPMQGCQRRCKDHSKDKFKTWNGQQGGCWLQVWRQFTDSCTQYQWYNTCGRYWDKDPKGAPKLYWTCCVH